MVVVVVEVGVVVVDMVVVVVPVVVVVVEVGVVVVVTVLPVYVVVVASLTWVHTSFWGVACNSTCTCARRAAFSRSNVSISGQEGGGGDGRSRRRVVVPSVVRSFDASPEHGLLKINWKNRRGLGGEAAQMRSSGIYLSMPVLKHVNSLKYQ